MAGVPMARVNFAARFTSEDLEIALVLLERGTESVLRTHLRSHSSYGSGLHLWAYGGWDPETQNYVSAEWQGGSDPWEACEYWGPLKSAYTSGANFCGSCGAARIPEGRYCGGCGTAFPETSSEANTIREQVLGAVERQQEAGSVIANLIESHSLADLEPEVRTVLSNKIRESFSKIRSLNFVDGASPGNSHELTLADAQRVAEQVVEGNSLNENDRRIAAALLTEAPLFFGWWGPFKAVLKFLDPAVLPQQFGEAIARLESPFPRRAGTVEGFQNTLLLSRMFTVPGESTANYMRRRVRRDLRNLALTQPDVYAKVAFGLLRAWDSSLTHTSFAPAYVLLGGSEYLDEGSRQVKLPVSQASRCDAHPEIWNQFSELAVELISHVKKSAEVYTFARQVLRDNEIESPALTKVTVPLALMSTDRDVYRSGQAALSTVPDCWTRLSDSVWRSFFIDSEEIDLQATVSGLLRHERIDNVAYAAYQLLDSGRVELSAPRWEAIAKVYLAYSASTADQYRQWPHSLQADITAVTELGSYHDFSLTREMWISVLSDISVEAIIAALNQLTGRNGVPAGSQLLLADLAVKKDSDWHLESRIKACLGYGTEIMRNIAWRTADLLDDQSRVLVQVSDWLRQSDINPDDRIVILHEIFRRIHGHEGSELLTNVLTDSSWGFTGQQIVELIPNSTEAALLLWTALGAEDLSAVLSLVETHSHILTQIGESLTLTNTQAMSSSQLAVLSTYLLAHPDRISSDPEFGVHLACSPQPSVQRIAIDQLTTFGHMPRYWLMLAESALPLPLNASLEYVLSIKDSHTFTDSVLVCIDSPVQQVRDFGLQMLDAQRDRINQLMIWDSLIHTDDPVVQARVVEESLIRNWEDDHQLSALDQRLLVTRRGNRRTKERIKLRIQNSDSQTISPRRIAALQDMASGRNTRDREWALQRLAHLSLAGVDLANIEVSVTSEGMN